MSEQLKKAKVSNLESENYRLRRRIEELEADLADLRDELEEGYVIELSDKGKKRIK